MCLLKDEGNESKNSLWALNMTKKDLNLIYTAYKLFFLNEMHYVSWFTRYIFMERHDCLKDIDSCCACSILCRWIGMLCCLHIMMSCASSILCRWIVILCCHHIMMSCASSILCRWIVILCFHHIMMSVVPYYIVE